MCENVCEKRNHKNYNERSKILEIPYILARYNVERVGLAVGAAWPHI